MDENVGSTPTAPSKIMQRAFDQSSALNGLTVAKTADGRKVTDLQVSKIEPVITGYLDGKFKVWFLDGVSGIFMHEEDLFED